MSLGTKVTCKEFIEFLTDYLDGELEPERRQIFAAHLGICDSCVEYVRTYRDTMAMAKAAHEKPDDPVSDDVPEHLVAAILASRRTPDETK